MSTLNTFYNKLRYLVEKDQASIYLILSPPRTSSTLLETVISQNQDIHATYHEPFVELGYYGQSSEDGYKKIVGLIESQGHQKVNVLIKEMSHWLNVNNEHKRFLPLVNDPVVLLIRNPLLSMESRIRKVLQTWSMRAKPTLISWLKSILQYEGPEENTLEIQLRLLDEYSQLYGHETAEITVQNI